MHEQNNRRIIAIAGAAGSGKDTAALIIEFLLNSNELAHKYPHKNYFGEREQQFIDDLQTMQYIDVAQKYLLNEFCSWKICHYADALKKIVSILTNIRVEKLNDRAIKDSPINNWKMYSIYNDELKSQVYFRCIEDCELYAEQHNIQQYQIRQIDVTPRILMQYIGTELLRNQFNQNVWIDVLFNSTYQGDMIIADLRYQNCLDDVKNRGALCVKIKTCVAQLALRWWATLDYQQARYWLTKWLIDVYKIEPSKINITDKQLEDIEYIEVIDMYEAYIHSKHSSDNQLDDKHFDYVIENDGRIDELYFKIKQMLIEKQLFIPVKRNN